MRHSKQSVAAFLTMTIAILVPAALYTGEVLRGTRDGPGAYDDAYMFVRYADHFLSGYGIAWNPNGPHVYGVTSLLYFFIITILRWGTDLSITDVLLVSSCTFGLTSIMILSIACARLSRSTSLHRRYVVWLAIFCPLLLANPLFVKISQMGMDTTLSLLCNIFLGWSVLRIPAASRRISAVIWSAIAAYVAYFARPDNGLYCLLFPTLYVYLICKPKERYLLLRVFAICWAIMIIIHTTITFAYFGDILPLSFYVKTPIGAHAHDWFFAHTLGPLDLLSDFLHMTMPFGVALLLFARSDDSSFLAAILTPVAFTTGYYMILGSTGRTEPRLCAPSIAFLAFSAAITLDRRLYETKARHIEIKGVVVRCVWLVICTGLWLNRERLIEIYDTLYRGRQCRLDTERVGVVKAQRPLPVMDWWDGIEAVAYVANHAPPGTKIALSEHGLIGAVAPEVILIDTTGLHDPFFAHYGFSVDALFARHPDLIWGPHFASLDRQKILESPAFLKNYDYYADAFNYGIAIRRDSCYHDLLEDLVRDCWRKCYPGFRMEDYLVAGAISSDG